MKQLRFWITALILWLIFFFNVERINSPINIRSYTYIFVAIVAAVTLVAPRVQRVPFLVLLSLPVPVFLGLKAGMEHGPWYDNLLNGYALPMTVTQVSSIILTGLLARQINHSLHEFEGVIANITFSRIGKLPKVFAAEGQGAMYREVKRARRFHRPLAVVAVKVNESDMQAVLPQMVQDVQNAMMREYVMAGIARILDDNMHDFDTIAIRDNCFVLVLPEVMDEELPAITQRLDKAVRDRLNIKLQIGASTFPTEAITFESLVEQAIQKTEGIDEDGQAAPQHSRQRALTHEA